MTTWKKGQNYTLNQKHIDTLKQKSMTNIRRYALEDRIWVTLSKQDFNTYLDSISTRTNNKEPMLDDLAKLQTQSRLQTTELLTVDQAQPIPSIAAPVLQARQHGREALINLCKEISEAAVRGKVNIQGEQIEPPNNSVRNLRIRDFYLTTGGCQTRLAGRL